MLTKRDLQIAEELHTSFEKTPIPRDAYQIGNTVKSEIALQELLEGCIDRHTLTTVLVSIEQVLQAKVEHIEENWQDKALAKRWDRTRQAVAKAASMAYVYSL